MTVDGASARTNRTPILIGVGVLILVGVLGGGFLLFNKDTNQPTASPTLQPPAAGLDVAPAGALLPAPGATKLLAATRPDGGAAGSVTWTSSKPETATVDATGLVTAKAFGSTQITATAGDRTSPPVLITVAAPAPGTVVVEDGQVVGDPVETNPDAPVTPDSTYDVVLRGVTVKVGDLLLGTGEIPVGGRVTATTAAGSDTKVTLAPATLPELLPDLEIDETIDLSTAPIDIPADVAANYDMARDGNTFRFTPKPAFQQQVTAAAAVPPALTGVLPTGQLASTASALLAEAIGTHALPPFGCEPDEEDGTAPAILPFKLSEAPSFEVEVNPALDILWTDTEKHVVLEATPRVVIKVGVKSTVAFSLKYECKVELWRFRVPAGWLALIMTGLIPVGVGFEIGGEVQVAEFGMTYSREASANLRLGIDCPPTASCSLVREANPSPPVDPKVEVDVQNLADFRVKPAFELFGFMEMEIGNPFIARLRLEAAEIKVGVKVEADWAPRVVQILDTGYASKYGMTLELEAKAGPDLPDVAERLGLDDILSVGLEESIDLIGSPSGELSSDKEAYASGEQGSATIRLAEENLRIGSTYVIDHLLLVSYVDDQETILATAPATDGQREFVVPFTAPAALTKDQLFAFAVPRLVNFDLLGLELSRGAAGSRILFFRDDANGKPLLYQVDESGANERQVNLAIGSMDMQRAPLGVGPDGRIALSIDDSLYVALADGSGLRKLDTGKYLVVYPAFSRDGSKIAFTSDFEETALAVIGADGSGLTHIRHHDGRDLTPTWSPDGKQIAFAHDAEGNGQFDIRVVNADGSGERTLTTVGPGLSDAYPSWSPDGTRIVFVHQIDSNPDPPKAEIWVVNVDGSGLRAVTTGAYDTSVSWSPDGTRILFSHAPDGYSRARAVLTISNPDGSEAVALPTAPGAQWPIWAAALP